MYPYILKKLWVSIYSKDVNMVIICRMHEFSHLDLLQSFWLCFMNHNPLFFSLFHAGFCSFSTAIAPSNCSNGPDRYSSSMEERKFACLTSTSHCQVSSSKYWKLEGWQDWWLCQNAAQHVCCIENFQGQKTQNQFFLAEAHLPYSLSEVLLKGSLVNCCNMHKLVPYS